MKPIKIFTDSCSDMIPAVGEKNEVVSIDFTIYFKGHEISARPWEAITPSELYNSLRSGMRIYTLPATEHEIRTKLNKYVKNYDILYIGACEKQSTTIKKFRKVAEEIKGENPDYRIEVVDSLNASVGEAMVVFEACKYRDLGLSMEEIIEKILPIRNKVLQYVTVDNLVYLSAANKINARSASIGNFLNIKPILISDNEGNQTSIKSVKGKEKALDEIANLFIENIVDPEEQEVTIVHGDDMDSALKLKQKLLDKGLQVKKIYIFNLGPVVGITVGPGTVGVFGFGKEVGFVGE